MRKRLHLEALEDRTLLSGGLPFPTASTPDQLIQDINYANSNSGSYSVVLAPGATFNFTSANNSTNGGNALPVITGDITIAAFNEDTIEATSSSSSPFRLFDVAAHGSLTLQNVTLTGGLASGAGAAAQGGAIYSSGTLTLSNVTVQNNQAVGSKGNNGANASVGAINTGFAGAHSARSGSDGSAAYGGGLYVAGGTVSLSFTRFNNNVAKGGTGGSGGTATLFHEGTGGHGGRGGTASGGGLYVAAGSVTVQGGGYQDNEAIGGKGGIGGENAFLLHPAGDGGDGGSAAGGGLYEGGGQLTLSNIVFKDNEAIGGQGATSFIGRNQGGEGGKGGNALGGGLYLSGSSDPQGDIFCNGNEVKGGVGGKGGNADNQGGDGGLGGFAAGGAIYLATDGPVSFTGGYFINNEAMGGSGGNAATSDLLKGGAGGSGGNAYGGGLYVHSGTVTVSGESIFGNIAQGGNGQAGGGGFSGEGASAGSGGWAAGGGLYVNDGTVTLTNDEINSNDAEGGNGAKAGSSTQSLFTFDVSPSGPGAILAAVDESFIGVGLEALFLGYDALAQLDATLLNHNPGNAGSGGSAYGGGLYVNSGTATLNDDTLDKNQALGGNGGQGGSAGSFGNASSGSYGGDGAGGSLYAFAGTVVLTDDEIGNNLAKGGTGGVGGSDKTHADVGDGYGGNASGGGVYVYDTNKAGDNTGSVKMIDVTLCDNSVVGGNGNPGGGGGGNGTTPGGEGGVARGGGLFVLNGTISLVNDTVSNNQVTGGNAAGTTPTGSGGIATGGGLVIWSSEEVNIANTLIAENGVTGGKGKGGSVASATDPDVKAAVASSDHDLIGNSSGFSATTSTADILNPSFIGLGALANNGGSTRTEALLPNSPAIDAGDSGAAQLPSTDQRGDARIVGNAVDIGAYEYQYDLSITGSAPSAVVAEVEQPVVYSITVQNNGVVAAGQGGGVTLTDVLPAGVTYQSLSAPSGWTTSSQNGTVTATTATLAAGASASFALTVQADVEVGTLANTVTIGPATWDNKTSNNSVTLSSTASPSNEVDTPDTLAAAINYANNAGQPITITLLPGATFDFTSADNSTNGSNALPVITGDVTIVGNGDTIERTGSDVFRFFDVSSGGSLILQDLTLTGGLAQGAGTSAEGGAIYSSGTLWLDSVTLQSNEALGSNGVHGHNIGFGFGGVGGNGGNGAGGGLFIAAGTATLSDDILSDNQAQGGIGGVGGNGGSGANGNAGGAGGAGGDGTGGGMCVEGGSVTLYNDTLSGNQAGGGTGGAGGNDISDGSGGAGGVGGSGAGGGLFVSGGSVSLTSDTLSSNQAQGGNGGSGGNGIFFGGAGGNGGNATGGGLYISAGTTVGYYNTAISANTVAAGEGGSRGQFGQFPRSDGSPGTTSLSDIAANSSGFGTYHQKSGQTITFNSLPDKTYGDADFALTATASSGLHVSYSTSGPVEVYEERSGNWFAHITSAGTATITASQAGDSAYAIAPSVSQTFAIQQATPTVPAPAVNSENDYDGQAHGASDPDDDGSDDEVVPLHAGDIDGDADDVFGVNNEDLGDPTLTYYAGTYTLATLPSSGGSSTPPTNADDYTVVASYAGNANYTSASSVVTYGIDQATPTIKIVNAGGLFNGNPFPATATAVGVDGKTQVLGSFAFAYYVGTGTSGTSLGATAPTNPGTYTVMAAFTSADANYTNGTAQATFTISAVTTPSPSPAPNPPAPPSLNAPPLLALLDSLLGGVATVNADGTETITDSIFGIPLLVAKFNSAGNLTSISLFGIDVTFWFTLLG
jgi:uncharacterized repeat protein (TIGR01451 family)